MKRIKFNSFSPCFLLMSLLIIFSSCSRKYKLEGTSSVTMLDGKMLYLKVLDGNGEWSPIDSAEVVHGLFKMNGPADSVRMVTLYMDDESIMPVVLERGKIVVTISPTEISAKGTPLNDQLYDFIAKRNDMEAQLAELERRESRLILEGADADEVHAQLTQEAEKLAKEMNDFMKQFIIDNNQNVLGPTVFLMVCSSMPYPMMTPRIEEIMRTAPTSFKAHPLVRDFLDKAKENMQLIDEQQRMQENAVMASKQK
ncbi:MAG: DUF4369 domain-containing protein [Bacteroides sp.]|nr:DUF4369 domain-containing protein [Bacteroides sp.]